MFLKKNLKLCKLKFEFEILPRSQPPEKEAMIAAGQKPDKKKLPGNRRALLHREMAQSFRITPLPSYIREGEFAERIRMPSISDQMATPAVATPQVKIPPRVDTIS